MEVVIFLAIAGSLAFILSRWQAGRSGAPVPIAPPDVSASDTPGTAHNPSARLLALSAELSTVGDASSHPRDLEANSTFRRAVTLLEAPDVPLSVVTDFAAGANWMAATVACAALSARADRADARELMTRHFRLLSVWPMFYALRYFCTIDERPPVGSLILHGPEYWADHPIVSSVFAEHFADRAGLGDPITFGDALADVPAAALKAAETLLRKVHHPAADGLIRELGAWQRSRLDRPFLESFGRFVENPQELPLLVEHDAIKEPLATAETFLLQEPFRSVLVVGEPRVGKSSFLTLLTARAAARGWAIFEADAASLMSGQTYFGQLEERMRRLATELAVDKRVIWLVPDFLQLATSGVHTAQSATLLDQMLPAITAGRVLVCGEITAAGLTTVLQQRPVLRSALELVRLRTLSDGECDQLARDVSARVAKGTRTTVAPEMTETAMHLARHYLGPAQMPGTALDLIKLTVHRVLAHERASVDREDVLATLSQLTGMPKLILDDRERVDLQSMRSFFASRVIGQDEATAVVVDRIAMLKAGLTDPTKPIAVLLFAGPTGTGKTELAKTLSEFLFGSVERLIRLDMSEFQAVESTRKILGEAGQSADSQALTDRVRRQPFSVVLLDEFEKAHPQAWDLFLQVFDDGRLTDAMGRTVDFRHCIIILTSNLGSTIQQQAGPGFASSTGSFSQEHVLRAVNQSFRPEFVNRLDAIIVFRPLTRELMRGILAKELAQVLERRGLRHREWAVEWETSALDFLLEKGFSPAMGARPLKRAIDRYLLAPLASTLVEHRFPQGDQFLFVRSDGGAIQVEFVDPDAPSELPEPSPTPGSAASLSRMMVHANGTAEERTALSAILERVETRLSDPTWIALETGLTTEMQKPDFWHLPYRIGILSRYALIDRVKAATGTARGLDTRLARSERPGGRYSRDLVSRLAIQLYLIQHGIEDVLLNSPVEIVLAVQPALGSASSDASARWSERLLDMYRQWAGRRHLQWDELAGTSTSPTLVTLSGFGAARILERESGLHVMDYEDDHEAAARTVARVTVAATPDDLPDAPAQKRQALLAALNNVPQPSTIIRRYRLDGSPLIRDVAQGWRTGREDLVLTGNFDVLADLLVDEQRT
jgi:ATP-dependent Clp protease ATP-binding subunit ClpC